MDNYIKNIKHGRDKLDMSQKDLAKLLKISQRTMASIELGKAIPGIDKIIKMARIFDFNISDFILKDIEAEGFSIGKVSTQDAWILQKNQNLLVPKEDFKKYIKDDFIVGVDLFYVFNPLLKDEGIAYRTFEITDDSMAPLFVYGDWVGCSEVNEGYDPNKLYALVLYSGEIIVRYMNVYKDGFMLIPANSKHESLIIDTGNLKEIWEVKCRLTRQFQLYSFDVKLLA